jgi:GNAT superfamily N-acetyltransferase
VTSSGGEALEFRDLDVDFDAGLLARMHSEVLVPSFSEAELDDVETMARGLRGEGPVRTLASVALDGKEVVGGVVGEVYEAEEVLLLAYLAARPGGRGRGVGSALLRHVAPRWYPPVRLAVGEVHDPRRWSSTADEDPVSRLRFYERVGARVLGVPFVQPALEAGGTRIEGFLLIAFHVDPAVEVHDGGDVSIRSDLVGRFVRRYYATAEGAREPYDAQLAQLLARIDGRATIPLHAIADYDRVPPLA